MRLQSIKLTNFRQFKGTQVFDLNSDAVKPVTLVFGANGAGKTTLLNAFRWGLYGDLSEDVEEQHRMVTESVWRAVPAGDSVEVAVELCFDHEGQNYRLRRSANVRKESDEQGPLSQKLDLWTTLADGSSKVSDAPQSTISSILPDRVSRFFFFNGERIENLVKKGAYAEVKQDVRVLLNLEQVDRAIKSLPLVNNKLTNELKKHGGETAAAIQDEIDALTEDQTKARDGLVVAEDALATLEAELDSTTEQLRRHQEAAPIQAERDVVERELAEARATRDTAKAEQTYLIATEGFQAFTSSLGETTEEMAAALYRKGALPAPLKREFVDQLLDEGTCICGASLAEGSNARGHVDEWRHRAALQDVEAAWQKLRGQVNDLAKARGALQDKLATLVSRIEKEDGRVARLEARKSELGGKLKDSVIADVAALESKSIDLKSRIGVKNQDKGALTATIEEIDKKLEQKTRDRSRAEVTDELAMKARSRSDLVLSVRKALEEILAIREDEMRRRLDAKVKIVFEGITWRSKVPTLNESFELSLHENIDGVERPAAKSTGENQILSLSFVAAVSELAREVHAEHRAGGTNAPDAGTFPIVMDAAFGSLDMNYQEAVSRALAKMAPQLVVLVSKSQGLGEVLSELRPYVSNLGVIEAHTTAANGVSEDIVIDGTSYPYIRSDESDHSELKVIK